MSEEGDKGGGGLEKMMNSEFEGEKRVRERERNEFCSNCRNRSGNKTKRNGSGLATSPLSVFLKIKPLRRLPPSVRADGSSNLTFRRTLTDEWEVFRGPN